MSRKLMFILALSIAPVPTAAFAQSNAENAACRHDAVHLCRGISEDYKVRDCLVAQKHRLSHGCRAVLESHGY